MAEEDTGQERSEQPTAKRLDDARKKGQVPRSRELNTMMVMMVAALGMYMLGHGIMADLTALITQHLQPDRIQIFDRRAGLHQLYRAMIDAFWLLLPFFGLVVLAALLAPMLIGGWAFSFEALQPKLSKLDPIKGIKRIFSAKGLMELVKAFIKFVLVAAVAVAVIRYQFKEFISLGHEDVDGALGHTASLIGLAFIYVTAALVLIALVDVPFQIWDHNKQMRMTKQEVKDEMKDTEGKPEVRARVRQLQREMANARMMEAIPTADVVVTNPTHFSVALKYDQGVDKAPVVVAKGADLIARRIREIAAEHGVMRVETPPLARALYYTSEIGQEIPQGLYVAVAQILAYVYQLKSVQKNGGEIPSQPDPDIPDAFRKYADRGKPTDDTVH